PSPPPTPAFVLARKPATPAPAPQPFAKGSKILFWAREGRLGLIDPDGKNERRFDEGHHPVGAKLSPDETRFAALLPPANPPRTGRIPALLHVRGLNGKGRGTDLGVE